MVQWNVRLSAGCLARNVEEPVHRVAGQGSPSRSSTPRPGAVARSHVANGVNSEYSGTAQRFLELRLKTSYAALEADETKLYDAALYWRFLYEQTAARSRWRHQSSARPLSRPPAARRPTSRPRWTR